MARSILVRRYVSGPPPMICKAHLTTQKHSTGRAVTTGTFVATSHVKSPHGLGERAHVPGQSSSVPWRAVSAGIPRISSPVLSGVQKSFASIGGLEQTKKDSFTKKGGFLRSLEKMDFLAKSRSMTRIRSDESDRSILRHFSHSRSSKKKGESATSSTDDSGPRSRSTTNSSCRMESSIVSESAVHPSRTPSMATQAATTLERGRDFSVAEAGNVQPCRRSFSSAISPLCARIQIVPESESLETDHETSICVVVNVTADIELLQPGMQSPVPMDVVVCIRLL